jgi:class 3 adenylate cyclase
MDRGIPRATVTFLFTDIEGSTELSRHHGASAASRWIHGL